MSWRVRSRSVAMAHSDKIRWTPQQREAIETTGTSLLVSAAAGSGKTAVLAERCAYLVCDAPQKCDVDQLLVVTFTKSAAAEMKVGSKRPCANDWRTIRMTAG